MCNHRIGLHVKIWKARVTRQREQKSQENMGRRTLNILNNIMKGRHAFESTS